MKSFLRFVGGLGLLCGAVSAHAANLADPTYLKELERASLHTWAVGQVCLEPSGNVILGPVGVTRPIEGFPLDTVSCKAQWAHSDGVVYKLGHLLAYSSGNFASWEEYHPRRRSADEPHVATYAEAWSAVTKLRSDAGLKPFSEELIRARCYKEFRFSETELPLPRLVPGAAAGELKTVAFVRQVEAILASPAACAEQKSRLAALFAQAAVSDPRDWAWISWAARHPAAFFTHKIIRSHIGAQSQMARLLTARDHDAFTSETFLSPTLNFSDMMDTIIRFNLAVNGTESEALAEVAPGKSFGQFAQLPKADQERWLELVAFRPTGLTSVFVAPTLREERLTKFREACDKKLASVLGGPRAEVAGSGYELPFNRMLNAADNVMKPRWHVFSNLHIYDGGRGEPLYVPPGGTPLAGGTDENACFVTYYRKFGNYGPSRLVTCHVAEAGVTRETNANGSVRIGMIGGPGGSGGADYSHSHLILYTSDKSARLNFVDAFCR